MGMSDANSFKFWYRCSQDTAETDKLFQTRLLKKLQTWGQLNSSAKFMLNSLANIYCQLESFPWQAVLMDLRNNHFSIRTSVPKNACDHTPTFSWTIFTLVWTKWILVTERPLQSLSAHEAFHYGRKSQKNNSNR